MKPRTIFKVTYTSKLKPSLSTTFSDLCSLKNVMATRQFFYFLFFMGIADSDRSFIDGVGVFKKPTLMVYTKKQKLSGFLRAPYRHKKAQIRLSTTCYRIVVQYAMPSLACNWLFFSTLLNYFFNLFAFFDSPLVTLHNQALVDSFSVKKFMCNKRQLKTITLK